jgi:hypothetical protein
MRQFTLAIALIVGVGLALMPVDYSFAQAETLQLGTTDLRLDMKKTEVLQKLRSTGNYELKESPLEDCSDAWEVKRTLASPYPKNVGHLCFKEDKLVGMSRTWADCKGEDVFNVTRAVFSILNSLEKEGRNRAKFHTESKHFPEATLYMIHICIDQEQSTKEISIGIADNHREKRQDVWLIEGLSKPLLSSCQP